MILKMYQILAFEDIYNKIKDTKMPIKVAYKFSKLTREVDSERVFYQSKLQSIIDTYGEKDSEGNFVLTEDKTGIQIVKENLNKCQEEVNELSNLDVEINGIEFNLEELENLSLTLQELDILMPFIKE